MKSKKGGAEGFIVGTIITLIAFFLIGGLLMRFASQTSDKEAELLCQNSIAIRARNAVTIGGDAAELQAKLIPPLCRTIDKKVSGSREQILRQIADKMATCWWMFGEGRYEEILDNFGVGGVANVLGMEGFANSCFNCYTILIDEDELDGGPIQAEEINEFLLKEKYPKVNVSYLSYIEGYGGPGRIVFTAPVIFPNQAYTISMMPKNEEKSSFWTGVQLATITLSPVAVPQIIVLGVIEGVQWWMEEDVPPSQAGLPVTGKALPIIGIVALAGAQAYFSSAGYMNLMTEAYKERDVSSIYFGFLEVGQEQCGSGDIAGQ